MAPAQGGDRLRKMAEHRGLKLLRSRKRTPGTGDYGKFGLVDLAGEPVLGIGPRGLTATPDQIEAYLRSSSQEAWKRAAKTATKLKQKPRPAARARDSEAAPVATAQSRSAPQKKTPNRAGAAQQPLRSGKCPRKSKPVLRIVSNEEADPAENARLTVRPAVPADAAALASLLGALAGEPVTSAQARNRMVAMKKAGAGLIVAEDDMVAGCCAWTTIATLQHGLIGRLTLLVVGQRYRRRGIATALVASAREALAKAGCSAVEVMSDIQIDNAHNFFRALGFAQQSYRFVRSVE